MYPVAAGVLFLNSKSVYPDRLWHPAGNGRADRGYPENIIVHPQIRCNCREDFWQGSDDDCYSLRQIRFYFNNNGRGVRVII